MISSPGEIANGYESQLDKTRENYHFLSNKAKEKTNRETGMAAKANRVGSDLTDLSTFLHWHTCDLSHKTLTTASE